MPRGARRGRALLAALLPAAARALTRVAAPAVLLALLLAPAGPRVAPAQAQGTPNVAELRRVIAVRDAQGAGKPDALVATAQAYLAEFGDGRYSDEVLLALARGYAAQERPELALQTYNRLIETRTDSPFREQAMAESVPLLQAQGDQSAAFARVDALVEGYPNSLRRSQVLLWKAETQQQQGEIPAALATLERIDPQEDLAGAEEADYYRLQTLALVNSGQSAWAPLQRYLKRDDTPEHKAEVLMLVGDVARKADRPDEALRFYSQVVEDYPVKGQVGPALYWRAELFARTRLHDAPEEVRGARRETAIGYFAAYLESGDKAHRADALVARAGLHREAGRLVAAQADYDEAARIDPAVAGTPGVVSARVSVLQGLGQAEQAVALLEKGRQNPALSPAERTGLQVQLAALHYEAKRCEQVEALLNPMPIVADPQLRPRAFFMRGFCRYQREEWEKATFDLEGLINDPNYQELALEPLLEAYEQSGQTSRLVNLAEELLAAGRVQPTAPLLTRLADGYDRLGEPALMLAAFQRLEQADPAAAAAPEIQLRMGQAREKLGQPEAASAHYRGILEREGAAKQVPPAIYLTALERLQALSIDADRLEALPALHKAAAGVPRDDAGRARLAMLKRDLDVALARRDLRAGKAKEAVPRLEAALKQTPPEQPGRRARVVALLVTAYGRTGAPDKAAALYTKERKGADEHEYRPVLATELVAAVRDQPEALEARGKGGGIAPVYQQALADLPPGQSKERHEAAMLLDSAYQQRGDHAARAALVTLLLKDGYDDETKRQLRVYQGQIYKDWGRALLEQDDLAGAEFQLQRGLESAAAGDWRERYELTALLSRVQLKQARYSELVVMNEAILPEIEDSALAAQVRHFLGQVYVQWGKSAEEEDNAKSARIRYGYALDYLPAADWQRRLAATAGLAKALQAQGHDGEAAAAYEAVLPQIPDAGVQQKYALYLGKLYAERVGNPGKASQWFRQADRGDKEPLSLEAGYLWADQQAAARNADAALTRLKELAARGIAGTRWEVPIHYRLAILLHERKELKDALAHYRIVAGTQSAEARKVYPRSIAQSREQVQRIERFLQAGGGAGEIAVPAVRLD